MAAVSMSNFGANEDNDTCGDVRGDAPLGTRATRAYARDRRQSRQRFQL